MIILRRTLLLLAEAFPVAAPPPSVRSEALGVVPVTSFSSAVTEAMKAMMMAFLSIASFRAVWMAVLSSSVQVLIVKVGALHLIETSVDAGLFEVVMVVVMVEQDCCCLLPRSRAWFESKIASSSFSSTFLAVLVLLAASGPIWGDRPVSSFILSISFPKAFKFVVSCFKVLRR